MPRSYRRNWEGERTKLLAMRHSGQTLEQIALHYGCTKDRINQVLGLLGVRTGHAPFAILVDRDLTPQGRTFKTKKHNCLSKKIAFEPEFADLEFPTHCPVLGIELVYGGGTHSDASASFDCVDPKRGYVHGNVRIISMRANRIKNNGTAEEHRRIASYMESIDTQNSHPCEQAGQ